MTARIIDKDDGYSEYSTDVVVRNVPVEIVSLSLTSASPISLDPLTIEEADSVTLEVEISDPGVLDVHTFDIDWGDGDSEEVTVPVGDRRISVDHQYLDNDPGGTPPDTYTVSVTVDDDGKGFDSASEDVVVNNVDPTLTAVADATNFSGDIHAVSTDCDDPGTLDTHTATIDWGEVGGVPEGATVVEQDGSGTVSGSHQYFLPGDYTVTIVITDKDGGTDTTSHKKTVVRVPAVINIKPGNAKNNINPGAQGVVPVVILTTQAGEYASHWTLTPPRWIS